MLDNYRKGYPGFASTFVGNGIGRFAYIALIPALIQANWFSQKEAYYLGVMTLIGYFIGAIIANLLASFIKEKNILRYAMLISSFSYMFFAFNGGSEYWYYSWRLLAGISGALLMIIGPSNVLKNNNHSTRNQISGVVFSGIGIGVFVAGSVIPLLIMKGIVFTWVSLGIISFILTITTWNLWFDNTIVKSLNKTSKFSKEQKIFLVLVLLSYALNAIGYIPHTLFWVDYIVRELHMPFGYGSFFWAVFGIGAAVGPLFTSGIAQHFGVKKSLIFAFSIKSFAVFLPIISSSLYAIFISSFLVGAMTPGTVTLVALYTLVGAGADKYRQSWNLMTLSFAFFQAIFSYLMAYAVDNYFHSYRPLFIFSSIALLFSVLCVFLTKPKMA